MKKFVYIRAAFALLVVGLFAQSVFGQTPEYLQTITNIQAFHLQKPKDYNADTGVLMSAILQGLIDNYVSTGGYSEGLKKRLLSRLSIRDINALGGVMDPREVRLLKLLYYSQQSVVPAFITDKGLRSRFGAAGLGIKKAQDRFWRKKALTEDLIRVLEDYPQETSAILAQIVAQTWHKESSSNYEYTRISWASDSLSQVYFDVRKVQLAQRSVALRLIADKNGPELFYLPAYTQAEFRWSGWPPRTMDLSFEHWTERDVLELQRLLNNPYYEQLARKRLHEMGYK